MLHLMCTLKTTGLRFAESRRRGEEGQTAAEYLGIVVVIAIIIAAIAGTDIGGDIAKGIQKKIADILTNT
jgi:pilus assembly protein Flp/PilA